ncbi:hypothetical protein JHK87_043689 [Glycine soja]|nr:hypothetical protein JHK87_043689 [Glycine soja]
MFVIHSLFSLWESVGGCTCLDDRIIVAISDLHTHSDNWFNSLLKSKCFTQDFKENHHFLFRTECFMPVLQSLSATSNHNPELTMVASPTKKAMDEVPNHDSQDEMPVTPNSLSFLHRLSDPHVQNYFNFHITQMGFTSLVGFSWIDFGFSYVVVQRGAYYQLYFGLCHLLSFCNPKNSSITFAYGHLISLGNDNFSILTWKLHRQMGIQNDGP